MDLRKSYKSLLLSLIGGFVGGMLSFTVFAPHIALGSNAAKVLTVNELHIADADGSEQIVLEARKSGPSLRLISPDKRAELVFDIEQGSIGNLSTIMFKDKINKRSPISLFTQGADMASISMGDSKETWIDLLVSPDARNGRNASLYIGRPWTGHFIAEAGAEFATAEIDSKTNALILTGNDKESTIFAKDVVTKLVKDVVFKKAGEIIN